MKKRSIAFLILVLSLASCAIQEKGAVKEGGAESFQPKPLDDEWSAWLIGTWVVTQGQSDFLGDGSEGVIESDGAGSGGFTIEFGLNGQFLIWESWAETDPMTDEQKQMLKESFKKTTNASDEELERFVSMPFKELQIHTIDPKTGERIAYLFDSMRCIARGTGQLKGNKEIMEWQWFGTGQGARSAHVIEKINNNQFSYTHKYTLPDGRKMEDKIEMVRKKQRGD